MEAQLEQIREQQKASWDKFSPGWKKWDDLMMDFLQPTGDAIIQRIKPKVGDIVLDVAAGTGEPGLTIADRIGNGKVVITDLSDRMLDVAREHAAARGIRNVEFQACDVSVLPFPDNTFDAISCRFGFMFFPDMLMAAKEIYRVLKPGGKVAVAVWNGPENNFWITAIGGTINKHMQLSPPPPGAPGMFRCAKSGLLEGIFKEAGMKNTSETEVLSKLRVGTAECYWNMLTEVAAPFVSALSQADDAMHNLIRDEVYDLVNQKFPDGKVEIEGSALVISGEKGSL
jgi:ubiquinone/menaquinone biosynthesis C-methylase UbiE